MTHKTVMEYYPRNRSLVGRFIEIDDYCGPIEEVVEWEEKQYFQRTMESEIPIVYYGTDKKFHHLIFCYRPVVAYITFDDYDDFYPAVMTDNGDGYELFNPWKEDRLWFEKDEIIVAETRAFEDYVDAVKNHLIEHYNNLDNQQIFTSWIEMKNFMENERRN